ncbi:MAG: DUF58 domain-containing protein [Polyangiaceae bacterium]
MQLYPTHATFHVAVAGIGLVTLGAAARLAPVVAFGGSMLLALALGRAVARIGVARLRGAGFEMVWCDAQRVHKLVRDGQIVLRGELRNRGGDRVHVSALRTVASSWLDTSIEPRRLTLPPWSRAIVEIRVGAKRVGRWGVHGLALEVCAMPFGADGLYEVPLLFANPLGIEVLPRALVAFVASPRGGRARHGATFGSAGRSSGEGDQLRELRAHVPGDAFKRIAWKASARRGKLLVREMDRDERDVVWLVLDASVELWAGPAGHAPLDRMIDDLATMAVRHLAEGDRVGLVVAASRLRAWIGPRSGAKHGAVLASALASAASVIDVDRSELDEAQVARRVAEHARPLDPRGLADLPKGDLGALAARAAELEASAPFAPRIPFAPTEREQSLRHYLAAFGIEAPPRLDGERRKTEATMSLTLDRLHDERPRPTIVHVWAPPPSVPRPMGEPIAALRASGAEVRWSLPVFGPGLGLDVRGNNPLAEIAHDAVRARAQATRDRGERLLRRLGVRVLSIGPRRPIASSDRTPGEA